MQTAPSSQVQLYRHTSPIKWHLHAIYALSDMFFFSLFFDPRPVNLFRVEKCVCLCECDCDDDGILDGVLCFVEPKDHNNLAAWCPAHSGRHNPYIFTQYTMYYIYTSHIRYHIKTPRLLYIQIYTAMAHCWETPTHAAPSIYTFDIHINYVVSKCVDGRRARVFCGK